MRRGVFAAFPSAHGKQVCFFIRPSLPFFAGDVGTGTIQGQY